MSQPPIYEPSSDLWAKLQFMSQAPIYEPSSDLWAKLRFMNQNPIHEPSYDKFYIFVWDSTQVLVFIFGGYPKIMKTEIYQLWIMSKSVLKFYFFCLHWAFFGYS